MARIAELALIALVLILAGASISSSELTIEQRTATLTACATVLLVISARPRRR